ncbi:hypothetical protein LOTGIDRAFT_127673 [Lottia gigantea]|uniref:DIS3-like exonuclease 1 n=1 Tax=Lottia gigantea TaxID=225164 RepID=V3ZXZ4_LOTGI|nr:hypothetical protein LOTGIDRAFT_127673 [Lottia gigantea]ESO87500.1 hypothetical protein LOTGIDRAFT_127673 [Lottia gigantea]
MKLDKRERHLRIKGNQGRTVVRELYLREDVPCQSDRCIAGCQNDGKLSTDTTHYIVPDCQIARDYLEILETPEVTGIIFTQTAVNSVQHEGSKRLFTRLQNLIKDGRKASVVFHNEFHKYVYIERDPGESLNHWQIKSTYKACEWYYNHFVGDVPIVMLTNDQQVIKEYEDKTVNIFVLNVKDYLKGFWHNLDGIVDLYESITTALDNKSKDYSGYLPSDILETGIKSGRYIEGLLEVNRHNASTEAFVRQSGTSQKDGEKMEDIFVSGMGSRNRAIHGDRVVVEILPKTQWKGRSLAIQQDDGEGRSICVENEKEASPAIPTGTIVGILQRNWRDYVATFSAEEEGSSGNKGGKVLVIPYDYRIPKIRINTRQIDKLKDKRVVVRLDSWELGSQYPNGHFVKSLGTLGELETEVSAILVENSIQSLPFTENQIKELPVDTQDNPWKMDEKEIKKRRDLRNSHLVFSIDPKGCEDVDDTLSIRELKNGNLELGVHIADVTYFVPPGSLTDIEARSRSTTVYLSDRRYDMIPPILSSNLCSLISGVDRYAMSAVWELSKDLEVLNVWYGRTVIRSQYKLFYEIAQRINEGAEEDEIVENIPELQNVSSADLKTKIDELRWAVNKLMYVARILKSRRASGGGLELDSIEVRVEMEESDVEGLTPKDHLEVHETIAECMIFANHWVAKKIVEHYPNQSLLRHHPLPRQDQFEILVKCAASKGFVIDTTSNKTLADSLNRCIDGDDPVVNKLLRQLAVYAMSTAQYFSTGSLPHDQFFHYGLALDLYTHFTSPIRRYADIVVHRLLLSAIENINCDHLDSNKVLDELADHINIKHKAAQNAQRDSQELFQSLYFKDKKPSDEQCIVNAVIFQLRINGFLVYIPRYGIKGPVYLRNKEGQVVYINKQGDSEWLSGSINKDDQSISVQTIHGSQTYKLFNHIIVQLNLQASRAHSASLRYDLLSNKPLKEESSNVEGANSTIKSDIVKVLTYLIIS